VRSAWIGAGVVLALTVVLDVAFRHLAHAEYPWHTWPGFDFLYGLVGCAAIVYVSKWLGHRFLQRDEGYYEDER
jgi:hypothetical protein